MPKSRPTKYTSALFKKLTDQIRLGKTLKELCDDPASPTVLTVYTWLRDSKLRYDKQPLMDVYNDALEDRDLTWADEAATMYDRLKLTGMASDNLQIKLAGDKARMLAGLAKEGRQARKTAAKEQQQQEKQDKQTAPPGVTVEITLFADPEDADV